jgi:hypothetical protein
LSRSALHKIAPTQRLNRDGSASIFLVSYGPLGSKMPASSTQNTWRPRLNPMISIPVHQVALRHGLTDEAALLAIIRAGIVALRGPTERTQPAKDPAS